MHKISLSFLTVFDVGPVEAVRIAAATGYDMVGLRILPAAPGAEQDYPLLYDDSLLKEVSSAMKETGVVVADVEIVRLGKENDWDLFDRFCDRCAALGARHVLVAGDDPEKDRLVGSMRRFCEMAGERALTADLEFMPWTGVPDLKAARAIVEATGCANAGVLVDALHFDRSATTLEEVAALPRQRINYVQFCDGAVPYDETTSGLIQVARGERLLPGFGGIDLVSLTRIIPDDVPIAVEVPHTASAAKIDARGRAALAREATLGILRSAKRG